MKGSRLASTINSYWSSMALFSGPNSHAVILTLHVTQILFDYIDRTQIKLIVWISKINKLLSNTSYTNETKAVGGKTLLH